MSLYLRRGFARLASFFARTRRGPLPQAVLFSLIANCLLLIAAAQAQTTVPISGHALLPDGSAEASVTVRFQLIGCANGQAKIDGVGIFSDYTKDFAVNATTGAFSGALYPNIFSPATSSIDCNGTYGMTQYAVTPMLNGRANGQTVAYQVGPGAFNLDTAQGQNLPPSTALVNPVVTNAQGDQIVVQPTGSAFSVIGDGHVAGDFTIAFENPDVTDSGKFQHKLDYNGAFARISCSTDTGTVSINFEVRTEAAPNSSGTQVLSTPLVCSASTAVSTTFQSATFAANSPLALVVSSNVGASLLRVHVHVEPQ